MAARPKLQIVGRNWKDGKINKGERSTKCKQSTDVQQISITSAKSNLITVQFQGWGCKKNAIANSTHLSSHFGSKKASRSHSKQLDERE